MTLSAATTTNDNTNVFIDKRKNKPIVWHFTFRDSTNETMVLIVSLTYILYICFLSSANSITNQPAAVDAEIFMLIVNDEINGVRYESGIVGLQEATVESCRLIC